MKLPVKSLAALAVVAAASTAHAGSVPIGTSPSPTGGTLTLEVFTTSGTTITELVNLNMTYANTSVATPGNALTPNAPTGSFTQAANPAGAGNVLQIDFGVIPQFAATFGSNLANTEFLVINPSGPSAAELSTNSAAALSTSAGFAQAAGTAVGIIGNWNADTSAATLATASQGYAIDTTGAATWSAAASGLGGLGTGNSFSASVGTALGFYSAAGTRTYAATQYANSTGAGFWFLSSTGDLTYNVPVAATAVPLPAAAWLLVSGIAGFGAIGRRRRQSIA